MWDSEPDVIGSGHDRHACAAAPFDGRSVAGACHIRSVGASRAPVPSFPFVTLPLPLPSRTASSQATVSVSSSERDCARSCSRHRANKRGTAKAVLAQCSSWSCLPCRKCFRSPPRKEFSLPHSSQHWSQSHKHNISRAKRERRWFPSNYYSL